MVSDSSAASMPDSSARYNSGAIALHWLTALLVAVVGTIGLLFDEMPRSAFPGWLTVHALCGLTIFIIVIARMRLRAKSPPPELPETSGLVVRRLSHTVHTALYALLFITPILGVTGFITHGRSFVFGAYHIGFGFPATRSIFRPAEHIHRYLAYVLFAVAGFHILAALWHQFIVRDRLILRMWPRKAS